MTTQLDERAKRPRNIPSVIGSSVANDFRPVTFFLFFFLFVVSRALKASQTEKLEFSTFLCIENSRPRILPSAPSSVWGNGAHGSCPT
jgi:hypothetical protein